MLSVILGVEGIRAPREETNGRTTDMMNRMPRTKVSATVSPDRLARAREVTGTDSVSDLLDE
ncbi:MAG: hypothetical protein ACRDU8_07210, partial [Egibacteraceae bacterium]